MKKDIEVLICAFCGYSQYAETTEINNKKVFYFICSSCGKVNNSTKDVQK